MAGLTQLKRRLQCRAYIGWTFRVRPGSSKKISSIAKADQRGDRPKKTGAGNKRRKGKVRLDWLRDIDKE